MGQDLIQRLAEHRAEEARLKWTGTFADYFALVRENPRIARLAHARVFDMIMDAGVETSDNDVRRYKFFEDEIYGIEPTLDQIVEYFHSGAERLEVRKRILLLMGPVGGGKSTIVNMLKRGLERATRTEQGAVYAIVGCPMHEDPLHLIPEDMRPEIEREYGIYIEGELCPHCRHELLYTYDNRVEDVPVERMAFSEKNRIGIGTFTPSDPKSQDIAELVGGIDLSTIGDVGSESDPRAYRFDGELNIANRGVMEFIEMLKCLRGDTLIFTGDGIRRLDALAAPDHPAGQSRPMAVKLATSTGIEVTAHLYHAGTKPTKRITTRRGYTQEGTLEHRVLIVNEEGAQVWRRHDELQLGDWVVLQKGQNLWGNDVVFNPPAPRGRNAHPMRRPRQMSPALARWLGYLVAEGDTRPEGLIRFTNSEDELLDDFDRLSVELFGLHPRRCPNRAQLNSVEVLDFLGYLGFQTGAPKEEIPWSVLQSSREAVLEFLAGYFAGDGTVNLRGRLSWTTASPRLAEQLPIVLLNLGIVSRQITVHQQVRGADAQYWTITVAGSDADALARQMPLLPIRKRLTYEQRAREQNRIDRADILPNTAVYWRQISDALPTEVIARAQAVGGTGDRARTDARQLLGPDYVNLHALRSGSNACTRDTAHRLLTAVEGWVEPPPGLAALLNPAQVYDQIVAIDDGEADCWDVNVPGSNTFIANGFVNHNCDEKFLYVLLTLSQEQNIKTGRFAMIYADEVVVSHTNEHEYQSFVGNKKSEALQDRIILVRVPYNLQVSQEVKIYEKLLRQSNLHDVHIAPHTLETAATFAVLSRLEESKKANMSLLKKLKLYDGESVDGFTPKDVRELHDEAQREGMDGISPRYVINRLSSALVRDGVKCINAIDALRSLRDGLSQHTSITRDQHERLLNLIGEARQEYDEVAKREVQRAFVYAFDESAKTLLNNYLDNVEAFCNRTKLKDPITDEEVDPDEKLMRSIEEQIGVPENGKRAFREEILIRISSLARRGQSFDYTSHERLKEAIEKKLFADLRDVVKITTSTKTPDADQLRRMNEVIDRLVENQGYCPICANELLRYVGSLLNR